jgi:glycosyltransferase involved in cell wall biosynthesis
VNFSQKNLMTDVPNIQVLVVTSEWPDEQNPNLVPFIVDQINDLREIGIHVHVFSFRGAKKIINYLYAWIKLRGVLKKEKIDIIHAHFGQSGIITLPKKYPLVVTFHGSDVLGEYSRTGRYSISSFILKYISKIVANSSDEVIVVSEKLGQNLLKGQPYHVIPCGVNLEIFKPEDQVEARKQMGLPLDKKLVLFAGQKDFPVKRFDLAKKAISQLNDINVELLVVNNIPHKFIPVYLNACNALLMTSQHEGSPMIIKEALACNLPIVSTNVGDVSEIIGDVEGCFVCNNDDPESIASALYQAISHGPITDGFDRAKRYDADIICQKVVQVYDQCLLKKKR